MWGDGQRDKGWDLLPRLPATLHSPVRHLRIPNHLSVLRKIKSSVRAIPRAIKYVGQQLDGREGDSQTQLSGLFRLVITRTFPAALAIGIAQHTIRGEVRPLLPMTKYQEVKFRFWKGVWFLSIYWKECGWKVCSVAKSLLAAWNVRLRLIVGPSE